MRMSKPAVARVQWRRSRPARGIQEPMGAMFTSPVGSTGLVTPSRVKMAARCVSRAATLTLCRKDRTVLLTASRVSDSGGGLAMSAVVAGFVKNGVVVPNAPLPEGAFVEVHVI